MENMGNNDPQIFLGSISVSPPVKDKYEAPFETNFLFSSLSRLGLLYFFGFCLRLFRFILLPFYGGPFAQKLICAPNKKVRCQIKDTRVRHMTHGV